MNRSADNDFGILEAECQGCDIFARVDDLGLCEECSAKLDRDLIRQRDWDYSAMAFGVPPQKREKLRAAIIREYGEDLELIAPRDSEKPRAKGQMRKAKRKDRRGGR